MSRVIKFRAWDTHNQKMFSAEEMGQDELQINPDGRGFFNASAIDQRLSSYYPHLLPLQFTGEYYSDGTEVYEGDIYEYDYEYDSDYDGDMPIVRRSTGRAAVKDIFDTSGIKMAKREGGKVKRIGTIYENPELLKP